MVGYPITGYPTITGKKKRKEKKRGNTMTTKIIAKTIKGKEFFYNANSAYKVSANSAEKILTVLNSVRWNLSDN